MNSLFSFLLALKIPLSIQPIFGGMVATLFGFILTMLWEIYKDRKSQHQATKLFVEEQVINLKILSENRKFLEEELKHLSEQREETAPLLPLKNIAWEFLKIYPDKEFRRSNFWEISSSIVYLTDRINSWMMARFQYKLTQRTNYGDLIQVYDKVILSLSRELIDKILELKMPYTFTLTVPE